MKKAVLIISILGTTLFANMVTSGAKHAVKHENKSDVKHTSKKDSHKIDKTIKKEKRNIKKEKRKMEVKAVKAVL